MSMRKGTPILPTLVPQLEYIKVYSPIPIRIEQIRKAHHSALYADRFIACIPCCLSHVKWEVLFNAQNSELAPDVVFGSDDKDFQPLVPLGDEQEFSATSALLREWTPKDPSRLLRLLMELRGLYLCYQRRRVEVLEDPQVKFEIGTISGMEGLEMRLFTGADRSEEVQFALPLDIDLSRISRRLGASPASLWNGISLQVTFTIQKGLSSQGGAPQLKLHAPPALTEVFDSDDIKLPTWADRMCLMEYVPNVQDLLEGQVRDAINSIGLRKVFVEALGTTFGRPLEVELVLFRRVSVIVTSGLFCFLIHFALPTTFPKHQPSLTFQSSQHFDSRGKPISSRPYVDYPWSPRWEAPHMAQRILEFVIDECDRFKKHCTEVLQGR